MEFKKGDRVRYVPYHVMGDNEDPDCEDGVISSVKDGDNVFVKYDLSDLKMITGDEDYVSQLTDAQLLVLLPSIKEDNEA